MYDPNELEQPYRYLEVKCPYSVRDRTPEEACSASNFYCNLRKLKLKETHQYFAQVQGQMAIGERMWCDFVVYTQKIVVLNEYCKFNRRLNGFNCKVDRSVMSSIQHTKQEVVS